MIRTIIIIILLQIPEVSIGQDILGKWFGYNMVTYNDGSIRSYDIELEIGLDSLGRYTAIMTTTNMEYYSITALKGRFDKDKQLLTIQDSILIETNFNPDSLLYEKFSLKLRNKGKSFVGHSEYFAGFYEPILDTQVVLRRERVKKKK